MHGEPLFQMIRKGKMNAVLPIPGGQQNLIWALLHCADVLAPLGPCVDCKGGIVAAMGVVDLEMGCVVNPMDKMARPKAHACKLPPAIKVRLSSQHLQHLVPFDLSVLALVIGTFAKAFRFEGNDIFDELRHHFVQCWIASSTLNPCCMLVWHENRDAGFGFG